jgi:hypothetical protein
MIDILNDGKTAMLLHNGARSATLDTKHINDTRDPGVLEARALSDRQNDAADAPSEAGPPRLRLVADEAAESEREAGLAAAEAPAASEAAAKDRPVRSEFVIHPLARRLVPYWRRRR